MPKYIQTFSENGIEDLETILELQDEHLEMMGVPLGHKLKIMKKIKEMKPEEPEEHKFAPQKPAMANAETQDETSDKGPSLLDGEFNEAENQKQFKEAVAAWRGDTSTQADTVGQKPQQADSSISVNMETKLGPKGSCWNCFKLTPQEDMIKTENHDFCGPECIQKFKDKNYMSCEQGDCPNKFLKAKTGVLLGSLWYCSAQCADKNEAYIQ